MNQILREKIRWFLPRTPKAHRIRRGPLSGQWIYTSWHDYPAAIGGGTERALLAWFSRNVKSGETWLDVGAHYGYTAIALARLVGETGRVIAFEPVAATAGCASVTRRLNRLSQLHVVPLGLAADPGLRAVHIPVIRGMADSTVTLLSGQLAGGSHTIFVSAFDHLWETLSAGKPCVHGVKIDVQGMEQAVLAGMEAMLRRCHPKLVIEFHSGVDSAAILGFLSRCGYSPHADPVEGQPNRRIEANRSYAFLPK